ncbi:MAG: hypothetical protein ACU83O_06865 [Gammaproteobacteria bacterium]
MKLLNNNALSFFALTVLIGCASTNVISRQPYMGEKLARPAHIIVHDFAATLADIPAGSARAGQYYQSGTPQSDEGIEAGRKLGAEVAKELVAKIQDMGLPAAR